MSASSTMRSSTSTPPARPSDFSVFVTLTRHRETSNVSETNRRMASSHWGVGAPGFTTVSSSVRESTVGALGGGGDGGGGDGGGGEGGGGAGGGGEGGGEGGGGAGGGGG